MNMKKMLIIILLIFAVGVAAWYLRYYSDLQPPAAQPLNESAVLTPSADAVQEVLPDDSAAKKAALLRAEALKIVSRPVSVKISISETSRKNSLAKIEEMTNLIKDNYDYANAWYDLGAYRMVIGDYEGAIDAYGFVNLIRPDDYIGYANLGDIYGFYLKNYPLAEENFLKALRNNPAYISGYVDLAALYEGSFDGGRKRAEDLLLAGLRANPQNDYLNAKLAEFYERTGVN